MACAQQAMTKAANEALGSSGQIGCLAFVWRFYLMLVMFCLVKKSVKCTLKSKERMRSQQVVVS
jgi:hypothetical protein